MSQLPGPQLGVGAVGGEETMFKPKPQWGGGIGSGLGMEFLEGEGSVYGTRVSPGFPQPHLRGSQWVKRYTGRGGAGGVRLLFVPCRKGGKRMLHQYRLADCSAPLFFFRLTACCLGKPWLPLPPGSRYPRAPVLFCSSTGFHSIFSLEQTQEPLAGLSFQQGAAHSQRKTPGEGRQSMQKNGCNFSL